MLTEHIQLSDLVITTAAIPGKPLPKLIGTAQVAGMKAYEAPCKASPYVRASIAQLIIAADGRVASDIELAPLAIINTIFDRFYHAGARSPTWPDMPTRVRASAYHAFTSRAPTLTTRRSRWGQLIGVLHRVPALGAAASSKKACVEYAGGERDRRLATNVFFPMTSENRLMESRRDCKL